MRLVQFYFLSLLLHLLISFNETTAADVQLRELPLGSGIADVAYEPSTGQLIVAALTTNITRIAVLDTNGLSLGPSLLEGTGIAVIEPDGVGGIYVAFQGTQTVVHHNLRTGQTSAPFSFGLGHQIITLRVFDAGERLISVSKHRENPGFIDTTLFRDGVPLTNWVLSTIVRAVEPGGRHVFSMFGGHTKMLVDSKGLAFVSSFPMGPQGYNPDGIIDDGKIVVGTGHILNLDFEPLQTVPNAPRQSFDFNSVVFADPRTNVLAFVWQRPLENSFVLYDKRTGANRAELRIPLSGIAREIFPWGTDSYGLRWEDGEEGRLFIIDMAAVPRSDVSLTIEPSSAAATNGDVIAYKVTLQNNGPDAAESVMIHDALTFGLQLTDASATNSSVEVGANELFWTVSPLAVGERASLIVRAKATGPAFARNEATLSLAGIDPDTFNNRFTNSIPVSGGFTGDPRTFLLPATGMVADPREGEIYLSIPASKGPFPYSIVCWRPESESIEQIASYHTAPERLALSENGETLFVSLPHSGEIEQLDLKTNRSPIRFTAGLDAPVGDLEPLPGDGTSVLASGGGLHTQTGSRIFDNGIARTNSGPPGAVVVVGEGRAIQFHYDRWDLRELHFDSGGITARPFSNQVVKAYVELVGAGGRVFTDNGWVIDPSTGSIISTIPLGSNPLWAFDEEADEFYVLSHDSVQWTMKRYQLSTLKKLADVAVPKPSATPNALVKWKSRAYAYKTASEVVLFGEGEPRPADLALISTIVPSASGTAAEPFTWVLTITNLGPNDGTNVEVIAGRSGAATATWTLAGSTHKGYPNPFRRVYPVIKAGQSEKVELEINPSYGGPIQLAARIERFGEDPNYDNNSTSDLYGLAPAVGVVRRYGVNASDIAFNKPSNRLFLSVSDILSLDLETFHLSHHFAFNNPPGVLASSDVADVGFAAVEGNLMAVQFEVEPRFLGPMFPTATQPVFELLVQPGTTNVLVASHWRGITLFSNGIPREVTAVIGAIAFDPEKPDKLFHYYEGTVRRFHLAAEIIEEASATVPFTEQMPILAANGRLFFSNGQIVDQTTLATIGQLPGLPTNARVTLMAADEEMDRLYVYQQFGNHEELRFFSTTNFSKIGMLSLPYTDRPTRLRAFNGRAALLGFGQIVLFDIPPTNKTDLAITASSPRMTADIPGTLVISSWNNSPWTVGPGTVQVDVPPDFAIQSITSSNEFQRTGQTVRFLIPEFVHGQTNFHRITGQFSKPGSYVVNATVTNSTEEIVARNNTVSLEVGVLAKPVVRIADVAVVEGSAIRVPFWNEQPSGNIPGAVHRFFSFRMTVTNGTARVEEALTSTTNLTQVVVSNTLTQTIFSGPIGTRADNITNGNRTLTVLLSEASGVELTKSNLTINIIDDDLIPIVPNRVLRTNFLEGPISSMEMTLLSLSKAGTNEVRFDYNFRSETAILGRDFRGEPGTIVIPPGQLNVTVPFEILADHDFETNETFILELSNPVNAHLIEPEIRIRITSEPITPAQITSAFIREGRMVVRFRTIPNQRYRLLRSPELDSGEWTPVGDAILDDGGSAELTDIDPTPPRQRFYRIEQSSLFP